MRKFTIGMVGWLTAVIGLLAASPALAQPDDMDEKVSIRAVAQRSSVAPGGEVIVAVEMTHKDGWHSWPEAGTPLPANVSSFALRTAITMGGDTPPAWATIDGIQWPRTYDGLVPNPDGAGTLTSPLYSDVAVAFVRVRISADAKPGEVVLPLNAFYQACNDQVCTFPTDVALAVPLTIVSGPTPDAKDNEPALFAGFDASKLGTGTGAAPGAPGATGGVAKAASTPLGPLGLVTMVLTAMLGGFILNLMPCVLPVIPIKILSLSKSAGNPRRCFYLGAVASAGVIAAWMAAGLIAALLGVATNQLYTHWWFNVGIGLLIALMALGMLGAFVVNLPQSVYMVNPTTDSAGGSFIFGVFTVILALPCVAPFAGAVSSWALSQPPAIVLLAFFGIGLGMALPYLVLSARPTWINKIPRTGPASELVKQVLGGLMLAIAVYFLGSGIVGLASTYPDFAKNLHWWVITAIAVGTGVWMISQGFRITKAPAKRGLVTVIALVLAGAPAWMAYRLSSLTTWPAFSQVALSEARARGDVVIVDFTAEWCLNCKTLKATVLSTDAVERATTREGVTRLIADLTPKDAPGKQLLREVGENGIPLLLIYKPGEVEPFFRSNLYTADQVETAVDEALAARTSWLAARQDPALAKAPTPPSR